MDNANTGAGQMDIMTRIVTINPDEPDDTDTCTIGEYIDANTETISDEEIAAICTLQIGAEYYGGGGAAAEYIIRRVA